MSERKINLRNILESTNNAHGQPDPILAMKEACKQTLELAAENSGLPECLNKDAILDTLKQVE